MSKTSIEGIYTVAHNKERIFSFLSNMNNVSKCLKGLQDIKELSSNSLSSKIKISEGIIRGLFNIEASKKVENSSIIIYFKLYGTLGRAEGEIKIQLEEVESKNTKILYKADIEVKGLGATLAKKQISQIAEKILKDIFECFEQSFV
jgi:carbon monoxide dehydrogenase subunit G